MQTMAMKKPSSKFYEPVAIRASSFAFFCTITIVLFILLLVASQKHFNPDPGINNELNSRSNNESYNNGTYNGAPPTPTTTTPPTPTTAPPPSVFSNFSEWTPSQYFSGAYLPTLLAVLYSAYWDIIFMRLKEMEPFFRLAQPGGAEAKESLLLSYTGGSLPGVLVQALGNRHLVIIVASVVSLILTISVPFASEVLYIATSGTCTNTGDGNQCIPYLTVRIGVARFEEVVIGLVFLIAVWFSLTRRQSGVFSEPTSIAGLAVLLQEPELVETLQRASRISQGPELEHFFLVRKYGIGRIGGGEEQRTVLVTIHQQTSDGIPASQEKGNVAISHAISQESPQYTAELKPSRYSVLNLAVILLVLFMLAGLIILIIYYRLVGTPSGFESYMDSQSMGVHFLMTTIGVLIKTYWTSLEREIRTREPYSLLATGNARPETTILVQSRSHALTALPMNLFRRRFFLAYIALNAVLSEVLTVALSGVPFHSSQSWTGYVVSTWLSVTILFSMMVALLLVLFRERCGGRSVVPYHHGRILAPLLFLCHSEEILRDFSELGCLDTKMRNQKVEAMGRRYRYGRVADLDGGLGYGIEYDVLQGNN